MDSATKVYHTWTSSPKYSHVLCYTRIITYATNYMLPSTLIANSLRWHTKGYIGLVNKGVLYRSIYRKHVQNIYSKYSKYSTEYFVPKYAFRHNLYHRKSLYLLQNKILIVFLFHNKLFVTKIFSNPKRITFIQICLAKT